MHAYFPGNTFIYKRPRKKKKKKKNKLVNEAKVKPEILVFFAIKSTTPSPISPVSTRSFDPVFRNMKRSSQPCNFKFDEFSINRRQIKGHSNLSPPFPFPSPSPFFTNVVLVTADCLDDDSDTNWKRDNASLYGTLRQPERVDRLKSVSSFSLSLSVRLSIYPSLSAIDIIGPRYNCHSWRTYLPRVSMVATNFRCVLNTRVDPRFEQ